MRREVLLIALLAGCGRFDFDDHADAARPRDGSLDAAVDAPRDAPPGSLIVSFGERPGATHASVTTDTGLSATQPANNYGAEDSVGSAPGSPGLLRFDLSALAPGTIVDAAELHLGVDNTLPSGSAQVWALLEAWSEGAAMGAPGVANFTTRTGATAWTTAGAAAPGSRSQTLLASFTPGAGNSDTTIALGANAIAVLQGWIATPATNFGFAIDVSAGGGNWAFVTRESTTPNLRPLLVLTVH